MRQTRKRTENKRQEFNLRQIEAKTYAQKEMFRSFFEGYHLVARGCAGTGKSFSALFLSLTQLLRGEVDKIIIIRSAVASRDIGALPGTEAEKLAVYELPYKAIVNDLLQNGAAYEILKKKGQIEFSSTSFLRGLTFENAIIIIDEYQNLNQHELYTALTRVGENVQVIVSGDTRQCDLYKEESAFAWLNKVSMNMPDWFSVVEFLPSDIIRSGFCKELILVSEEL